MVIIIVIIIILASKERESKVLEKHIKALLVTLNMLHV